MLEASGGSGPPKARVLWGPIGTDGVNRRAVSPRSVFAHEPRVVFRDNKRATSSSVGNDPPFLPLSLSLSSSSSLSLVFPSLVLSFLPSSLPSALAFLERVKLPRYPPLVRAIAVVLLFFFFFLITRNLFLLSTPRLDRGTIAFRNRLALG